MVLKYSKNQAALPRGETVTELLLVAVPAMGCSSNG